VQNIIYSPIGIIKSEFETTAGVPIQARFGADKLGKVILLPEFVEGLKDLDGMSHAYLLYHFDRHHDFKLTTTEVRLNSVEI
jgi:tRNA (Thr-GGU) A37 N-methylase